MIARALRTVLAISARYLHRPGDPILFEHEGDDIVNRNDRRNRRYDRRAHLGQMEHIRPWTPSGDIDSRPNGIPRKTMKPPPCSHHPSWRGFQHIDRYAETFGLPLQRLDKAPHVGADAGWRQVKEAAIDGDADRSVVLGAGGRLHVPRIRAMMDCCQQRSRSRPRDVPIVDGRGIRLALC